jgi:hypothetical protein
MFKPLRGYFFICLVLVTIALFSSCGNGGNTGIVPSTDNNTSGIVNPTQTPVILVNKPVSGYIYVSNSTNLNILDLTADEFITQTGEYLQKEYPQDYSTSDIQELYNQLKTDLSQSKPLPLYDANARLFSVRQDSDSSEPIPVDSDGHFNGEALTTADEDGVNLEVSLNDETYIGIETVSLSDTINSSSVNIELKSCPGSILAEPGDLVIFEVYSEPSVNLRELGLSFKLTDNSAGCVTQPVYLCIGGKNKYTKAFGIFYASKKITNTPLSSLIIAKTRNDLTLNIPLEIVKNTASISGRVITGGKPLIKGFVRSIGPSAFCKLNSSGEYTLPRIFRSHNVKVVATWWVEENGKKVRYRQERVIEFFNTDVTDFNFGEEITPTPIPTVTPTPNLTPRPFDDIFYDARVSDVIRQKHQWIDTYGREQAIQMTLDWLNNALPSAPSIPEEIIGAERDVYDNSIIKIHFSGGHRVNLLDKFSLVLSQNSISSKNINNLLEKHIRNIKDNENLSLIASSVKTVRSNKILILAPFAFQFSGGNYTNNKVYGQFADDLNNLKDPNTGTPLYKIHCVVTKHTDVEQLHPEYEIREGNREQTLVIPYREKPSTDPNSIWNPDIVRPEDFIVNNSDKNYGVIYIMTHGVSICGMAYKEDPDNPSPTYKWLTAHKDWWEYGYQIAARYTPPSDCDPNQPYYEKMIILTESFFQQQDYTNAIVFMGGCSGFDRVELFKGRHASIYIGTDRTAMSWWTELTAYKFFWYMYNGLSANEAYNKLGEIGVNPDPTGYDPNACADPNIFADPNSSPVGCTYKIYRENTSTEIYLPAPAEIVIQKSKSF